MEYEKEVTVPAGTPEATPVTDEVILDKGILSGYVYFPAGCVHKVQVRIQHGEFQIAPWNPDGWLKGEGARVPFADNYPMTDLPYLLKIKAASPGTSYEHKPLVHASVLPEWIVRPEGVVSSQLKQLKARFETFARRIEDFMEQAKKLIPRRFEEEASS